MFYFHLTHADICPSIKFLAERVPGFGYLTNKTEILDDDVVVVVKNWGLMGLLNVQAQKYYSGINNLSWDNKLVYGKINDKEVLDVLAKYPRTVYLVFNSWEVTWLHKGGCMKTLVDFVDKAGLPHNVVFSSCEIMTSGYEMSGVKLWPVDWVYLREKYNCRMHNRTSAPSKRFVCLNRKSMEDRAVTMLFYQSKFPEMFNTTFITPTLPSYDDVSTIFRNCGEVISANEYEKVKLSLPMLVDGGFLECDWEGNNDKIINFIHDASIFLIFETDFNPTHAVQQVSEKLYQGVRHHMPFMVFGRYGGCMQHLKKLGFTTFAPWIDETYDDITLTRTARLKALFAEIRRLCEMPKEEFEIIICELNKIADINAEFLVSGALTEELINDYKTMLTR